MSSIASNRLNTAIANGTISTMIQIKALLNQVQALLPSFIIGFSPKEYQSIPRINVSNKSFTQDALGILANIATLYPSFINAGNLANDLSLYGQLDELATISRQLTEKIEDTQMLAGSEAYVTALSVYRLTEAAAVAGMPGADVLYQQLRERFATSGIRRTRVSTSINPLPTRCLPSKLDGRPGDRRELKTC